MWKLNPVVFASMKLKMASGHLKNEIKDLKDLTTVRRIQAHLAGVSAGNLGDVKSVGEGVSELRLAFGPGYRVYFGAVGDELIILLCGGDKSSQDKDIKKAKEFWSNYRSKNHE